MKKVKIIGIVPCYNELSKGHLNRFITNIDKVVDGLVILDDASTDGSYERALEYTPNVIRNSKNLFLYEHMNTQVLINKALEIYPDLTHILSLNVDCTFSPSCFKEGEALIHKFCRDYPSQWDMFTIRNINLWRSKYWWRLDGSWKWHKAERVYIRDKGLEILDKWHFGLHQMRVTANLASTTCISQMNGFGDVVSLHWGLESKDLIKEKFHYYMRLENRSVPCPDFFHDANVFNLLDEYNLKVAQIAPNWIDSDIKKEITDFRRPKPISYYSDLLVHNERKAACYRDHFKKILGYHNEVEEYF
jgi:glycosyltransferase involved in cell wall biosynthesis